METQEKTQEETPKVVSVVDFTAFGNRSKKIYEDKTEAQIKYDLAKMCETNILHYITNYTVSGREILEFKKPFEPQAKKVE